MSTTFHVATVNVACDSLICSFLMHVCCQIAILEYRLKKLTRNQITLGYCVRHHDLIYELVITLKNYLSASIVIKCELLNNTMIKVIFSFLTYIIFVP